MQTIEYHVQYRNDVGGWITYEASKTLEDAQDNWFYLKQRYEVNPVELRIIRRATTTEELVIQDEASHNRL